MSSIPYTSAFKTREMLNLTKLPNFLSQTNSQEVLLLITNKASLLHNRHQEPIVTLVSHNLQDHCVYSMIFPNCLNRSSNPRNIHILL